MNTIKTQSRCILMVVFLILMTGSIFLMSCAPAENHDGEEQASAEQEPFGPQFTGGARLQFEQIFIDLGTATPRGSLSTVFRFQNVGDTPLELYPLEKEALEGC